MNADHSTRVIPPDAALRLAAIVESSDDAIVSKDLTGTITSWNQGAERLFGYSADEAIGRSITMVIPQERLPEEDLVLSKIRRGERVDHFDTVRRRKDGTFVDISLTVSPIRDASGVIVGASKIARNISDRKRMEAQLQELQKRLMGLATASAALLASTDIDAVLSGTIEVAREVFEADGHALWRAAADGTWSVSRSHGLSEAFLSAVLPSMRRHPDDHDVPFAEPKPVEDVRTDAMLAHRLDAYEREGIASLVVFPLPVRGRRTASLVFYSRRPRKYDHVDLEVGAALSNLAAASLTTAELYAEESRARRAADHAHQHAIEASRVKDEFLATLSHELRTPLNAVLGYTRMLRLGSLPREKAEAALDVLERNATSLQQIIEDVLDVSRIVAGRLRLNVQTVDLPAVLRESVATVAPAAEAKGVRLDEEVDPEAPAVWGDPERIQQIVWNLLSNAIKFTSRGGQVALRLGAVESHVEITVSDTGRGIDAAFLPFVFERFRQGDATFSREQGGLGLGLSIAKQLTELHGGTIAAASPGLGLGSKFTVTLPIRTVHVQTA